MKRSWSILLAAMFCLAALLPACGAKQPENDTEAQALAETLSDNQSTFFPYIADVTEIPSPVSVVVKGETSYFLQSDSLPLAAPGEANSLLLVSMSQNNDDTYSCTLTLGNKTGDISVEIGKSIQLEKPDKLAGMLADTYSFAEGEASLLNDILAYETALAARDYRTAINACKDDYGSVDGLANVSAEQVCEPLVYMTDEDFVCDGIDVGTLAFIPAEFKQYVPPEGEYTRPDISGPVSIGIASIGRQPVQGGNPGLTADDVARKMKEVSDTFCFSEIVGTKQYGTFTSNESGISGTSYSYVMRVSVITMEGELLGWTTVSYTPLANDNLGLGAQLIGISLSRDKNGMAVFMWAYKSAFWDCFQ